MDQLTRNKNHKNTEWMTKNQPKLLPKNTKSPNKKTKSGSPPKKKNTLNIIKI